MFPFDPGSPAGSPAARGTVTLDSLADAVDALDGQVPDAELIDQISQLEAIKAKAAAAQAVLTREFVARQHAYGLARRKDPTILQRSINQQIGLARRQSIWHGRRHIGIAHALLTDMPHTYAALRAGALSEHRAGLIVDQFACLTPEGRQQGDTIIGSELADLSDHSAQTRSAAIAGRLDPEAVLAKTRGAVTDRHVSFRAAPNTMVRISMLLPVAGGVAMQAALTRDADTKKSSGDPRRRGQIMADTAIQRCTNNSIIGCDSYGAPIYAPTETATDHPPAPFATDTAGNEESDTATEGEEINVTVDIDIDEAADDVAPEPPQRDDTQPRRSQRHRRSDQHRKPRPPDIQLNLIMTDRTLLDQDNEPAYLVGHGAIPAALARTMIINQANTAARTWIRRLYTDPTGRQILHADARQRLFPTTVAKQLIARDQICRTSYCDAPIRQIDHITDHAHGGPTTITNAQGLCQACNLAKQHPDTHTYTRENGTITTVTSTGHHYNSPPPRPPRSTGWAVVELLEFRQLQMLRLAG